MKGLTDSAKKHMTGMVTANLGIPSAPSHYDGTEEMDYWDKETKEDFPTREHNANCEKKKSLVKEVVLLTEQGPVKKIERKWLISLLYKPLDKVKGITQGQLDKVIEKHPVIGTIYDVVQRFKQILFSKRPEELGKWIADTEQLNIEEILFMLALQNVLCNFTLRIRKLRLVDRRPISRYHGCRNKNRRYT